MAPPTDRDFRRPHQGGRSLDRGPPPQRDAGGGPRDRAGEIKRVLTGALKIEYFTNAERKALRKALVDSEAQEWAEKLKAVAPTQLRRFFGDVMNLKRRVDLDGSSYPAEAIQARLALLKAKAAYAARRDDKNDGMIDLLRFLCANADTVRDHTDFAAFVHAFEAVTAFHRAFADAKS